MVDLEQPRLPSQIMVGDGWAAVETGFRTWLRFGRALTDAHVWWPGIFPGPEPEGDWHEGALEFWRSPVACPHGAAQGGARTIDLSMDGDYVVGSFQQAYGIDLTDPALDMHWHRFLALLRSLPEDSMVARIGSWRAWTPSAARRKPEQVQRELRDAWALRPAGTSGGAAVAAQAEIFGGVVDAFAREVGDGRG